MGYSPDEVDRMSLWEFAACVDGWNLAHGIEEEPDPPSEEEHLKLVAAAKAMMDKR